MAVDKHLTSWQISRNECGISLAFKGKQKREDLAISGVNSR